MKRNYFENEHTRRSKMVVIHRWTWRRTDLRLWNGNKFEKGRNKEQENGEEYLWKNEVFSAIFKCPVQEDNFREDKEGKRREKFSIHRLKIRKGNNKHKQEKKRKAITA